MHPARDEYIQVHKHENTLGSWSSAFNFLCMPFSKTEKVTFSLDNVVTSKLDFYNFMAELKCRI